MTDRDKLIALAEACERHAARHFTTALHETNDREFGLREIDRGLECLSRAAALRARAHTSKETNNVAD